MKSWQEWSHAATQWYQTKPGGARWSIVIAGLLLFGLLIVSQGQIWPATQIQLLSGRQLTIDEIGAMQVAFGKSGLNDYEIQGQTVLIPRARRAGYLKSLADHGAIPPDMTGATPDNNGLEFLQTRTQQRQRLLERKKQTIRDMVQQMSFVQKSIVDYDEARGATPFDDLQRTAIVTVKPVGTRILEFAEIKAVRDTVRGAVAGLRSTDVTVIDINANRSWVGTGESASADRHPHAARRAEEERQYENKIRSALSAYPGIRVNVEVAVDPVLRRVRDQRTVDDPPVTVSHSIQREISGQLPDSSPSTAPRESTTVGANRQAKAPRSMEFGQTLRETQHLQALSSGSYESVETAGLTVTDVRVSIGIPERCVDFFVQREQQRLESATRAAAPPMDQQRQLADRIFEKIQHDIQQKVSPLIPVCSRSLTDISSVVVTIDPDIPLDPGAMPAAVATSVPWWNHWPIVSLGLIVIGMLIWVRPFQRNSPGSPGTRFVPATISSIPRMAVDHGTVDFERPAEPAPQGTAANNQSQRPSARATMRQELDTWCRENPEAAAATIRQWLDRRAG